jgi:hypothetical protein
VDPALALALAVDGIKIVDALLNAAIATNAAKVSADVEVATARLTALQQANAELSARVHLELQTIIAKG